MSHLLRRTTHQAKTLRHAAARSLSAAAAPPPPPATTQLEPARTNANLAFSGMARPAIHSSAPADPELDARKAAVAEIDAWWQSSRWEGTTRPYTAEQIADLRGSLLTEPASNAQAKKLWEMLRIMYARGECTATFGALDTVQVTQMSKYLDTIYVSGWQSSSTASTSNEPGPDVADYPIAISGGRYDGDMKNPFQTAKTGERMYEPEKIYSITIRSEIFGGVAKRLYASVGTITDASRAGTTGGGNDK